MSKKKEVTKEKKKRAVARDSKGQLKKGVKLNPKGRPKGCLNKTTKQLREQISLIVQDKLNEFDTIFDSASAKVKLETIVALTKYILPQLSKAEVDAAVQGDTRITVVYQKMEQKVLEPPTDNQDVKEVEYKEVSE